MIKFGNASDKDATHQPPLSKRQDAASSSAASSSEVPSSNPITEDLFQKLKVAFKKITSPTAEHLEKARKMVNLELDIEIEALFDYLTTIADDKNMVDTYKKLFVEEVLPNFLKQTDVLNSLSRQIAEELSIETIDAYLKYAESPLGREMLCKKTTPSDIAFKLINNLDQNSLVLFFSENLKAIHKLIPQDISDILLKTYAKVLEDVKKPEVIIVEQVLSQESSSVVIFRDPSESSAQPTKPAITAQTKTIVKKMC